MRCRSGRHEWTDPADATKCCDPAWERRLWVGGLRDRPAYGHYWAPAGARRRVPEEPEPDLREALLDRR